MFNKEAFILAVIDLPKYIRSRIPQVRGNMSIASQLDSVVDGVFVMHTVKGYPFTEISELLNEHGLKGINASNLTQWYRSRQKTVALLADCKNRWKKGELKLNGIVIPSDLDQVDAWVPTKDSSVTEEVRTEEVSTDSVATEVPSLAESHTNTKAEPAVARPDLNTKLVEKPAINGNLVLDWGVFLKSCRAEYNVTSGEVSAELVNRGMVNDEKELTRVNEYFPGVEPLVTLNWSKVKVKAALAVLLFE